MAWALLLPFFWTIVPSLLYYSWHIEAERKQRGAYKAEAGIATFLKPPCGFNITRSFCIVLGIVLLAWGLYAVCINLIAHLLITDVWLDSVVQKQHTGKPLTAGEIEAFQKVHGVYRHGVILASAGGAASAVGGMLLALGFNLSWRLREKQEAEPAAGGYSPEDGRKTSA